MTRHELDAAGITDPRLREAYSRCRRLNAEHGKTYFLATRLLTPDRRPAVHALYGFARWADDVVDRIDPSWGQAERDHALARLDRELAHGLATGHSDHPVVAALADTARRYTIDHRHFHDFMASMRMDLDTASYPTWADLQRYVHGSAAVIGLQVLPVLGTSSSCEQAAPHAAALGVAFQLTNFLRDVGEDLDRGRVYLPLDRLAAHGVEPDLLAWCRAHGRSDQRVRQALADLVAFNRGVYREAHPGIAMLAPVARPCVSSAFVLYQGILDEIVAADYSPVLHRRLVVSRRRRASVAAMGAAQVMGARLAHGRSERGRANRPDGPPHAKDVRQPERLAA